MIIKAYVVPHPPIILPEIGRGEERKSRTRLIPIAVWHGK